MKIETIETMLAGEVAVVRVRTDDGAEGIGQTSPFGPEITVKVLHDMVAPFFLGQDPWDVEALVSKTVRDQYKFPSTFILRALCGVDTAIWDLLGKVTERPVHKLIGGAYRTSIPVYASSMSRSISPEDEGERLLALREQHGFRAAKIRLGKPVGYDVDASPGRTERIIPHIREVMGADFDINADANGGFTAAHAIRIGRLLEDNGYFHFEEPCPYDDILRTAEVARALDIPVAGGEQDNSLKQFRRMIDEEVVDIIQPDIGYIGGVSRARQVAVMADIAGIPCTPHSSNNSMIRVFTIHFAAAMPACRQYQEWGIENSGWEAQEIYEPLLEVVDGNVAVPTAPGWGVELAESFIRRAQSQTSSVRDHLVATGMPS
jgi:L-alanine-DL-glutamate epimerase-like enolase superfamily enzyme